MQGMYRNKSPEWREGLQNHLMKAELEYVAKHGGGITEFLKPYLADADCFVKLFIKSLGFRVRRRFSVESANWIETTNGISICLDDGFCYKNAG